MSFALPSNMSGATIRKTMQELSPWTIGIAFCILMAVNSFWRSASLRKKMPPGPSGLPFVGNSHQMPAVKPWWKFAELNKQYGPVISLFFGNTPVIVLGKADAAWDLLEKRSDIYSSRPRAIMAGEILSDDMRGLMLSNHNERWRRWRKVLHTGFHMRRAADYKDIQSLESKQAINQILEDPKHYERHLQRYAASVVTSVTYGRRVESVDEWIVAENMQSMDYLTSLAIPGKYIVESWPWLLKLPRSLQWFRRAAEIQKQRDIKLLTHLVDDVKERMAAGTAPDCLTSQTLAVREKAGLGELELAYAVSSPFGAGIETTSGTLIVFMLAMLHYPEVMKKAQAELDAVTGFDRMPEFDDYDRLPYIRAMLNETLRWRPIAILGGQPHASTADDEYRGMFIPKGSTVFANFAGIMKDPEMFPDPEAFRPERFMETTNPRLLNFELPFGFGRRICPGMHLGRNSLFINIARILWAFDVTPTLDAAGKPVIPDASNFTNGFNSRPLSFDCSITPRNQKIVDCIKAEWEMAQGRLGRWS